MKIKPQSAKKDRLVLTMAEERQLLRELADVWRQDDVAGLCLPKLTELQLLLNKAVHGVAFSVYPEWDKQRDRSNEQ